MYSLGRQRNEIDPSGYINADCIAAVWSREAQKDLRIPTGITSTSKYSGSDGDIWPASIPSCPGYGLICSSVYHMYVQVGKVREQTAGQYICILSS